MTLHGQARIDILQEAKRDAVIHAKVWLDIARHLENQIAEESKPNRTLDLFDADIEYRGNSHDRTLS